MQQCKRVGGVRISVLLTALSTSLPVAGATVCDLSFPTCPDRFSSGTVTVPENVVALFPRIPACAGTVQVNEGAAAPSIVFLIDNSNSMGGGDPGEMRFAAVANLLDDIHAVTPSAEAGLVLFSRRLQFDQRDPGLFRAAFPGDTTQYDAYVPLTALDHVFPDGRTGLDTLKALLRHDDGGNLEHGTRRPASRENRELGRLNLRDGTDLTLAFEAALQGMEGSKASPAGRYLVLLSDGEPASLDIGREAHRWDFAKGAGYPTTFTISFDTAAAARLPDSLAVMNARIRSNGYSAGNVRSTARLMGPPALDLQGILRNSVYGAPETPAAADWARLEVAGLAHASSGVADGSLLFPAAMPLTEGPTPVTITMGYSYTIPGSSLRKEKRASYSLTIRRSAQITELPPGLSATCREQPTLGLYEAGREISVLAADQTYLEARLQMPDGAPCPACKVEASVQSSRARPGQAAPDLESYALAGPSGVGSGGLASLSTLFPREISGTGQPGDGRLQHLPGDSLILIWRNPANPLDRVRRVYGLPKPPPALGTLVHNDVSRTQGAAWEPSNWLLVGAPALRVSSPEGASARTLAGPISRIDSLRYVGLQVAASRSFRADIRVYDNLGQFVNRLSFRVPAGEFSKLPLASDGRTRRLTVLWDNRAANGNPAGTGSYVLKSTVTLDRLPGLPEEDAEKTEYRRVGVLRSM